MTSASRPTQGASKGTHAGRPAVRGAPTATANERRGALASQNAPKAVSDSAADIRGRPTTPEDVMGTARHRVRSDPDHPTGRVVMTDGASSWWEAWGPWTQWIIEGSPPATGEPA